MTDHPTTLAGEDVLLLPERAMYWPRMSTLLVTDAHWGKPAAFRAAAIAVPETVTTDDLARLSRAVVRTEAQRLVFLGDLIHARSGRAETTLAAIGAWREEHAALEITLVRGNHDRGAGDPPPAWNITCADAPLPMPPFILQHHPDPHETGYTLAGHLHPAVELRGRGKERLTLPCFWLGARVAVLPAFGGFIGGAVITPTATDRVFVIADDQIFPLR
jgi:DNA ligase-associated metallophosphoesterase